jgi:hypothetical protein
MPYTADKPRLAESSDQLRARIPGWGADLDPSVRPSFPRERPDELATRHGSRPERQVEEWPRERSIEHTEMPAVFGTTLPPKGLAGVIRRYAFRYGEGRAAHWLLLMAADRVDSVESRLPDPREVLRSRRRRDG